MSELVLSRLTPGLIGKAKALAGRSGHGPLPGEDFPTFWQRLPITDPADHTGMQDLSHSQATGRLFFSSGGSTGTPKFTLLGHTEMLRNCINHGRGYRACGIGPSDTVAAWGLSGVMNSEFTMYLALAETGCCTLPIGNNEDPISVLGLITRFNASVLLAMPSNLIPVIAHLEALGKRLEGIRLVVTGGEPLYPAEEERFRRSLSDSTTFRSVFQTSDTGTIGYQCPHLDTDEFHTHDSLQLLELIDVNPDGTGHLVTSNLDRYLVPVVRQRTGDLARFIGSACPCGDESPKIKLVGRAGKIIKFGGEKFDLNSLLIMKEALDIPLDDFQAQLVRDIRGRDQFVIHSRLLCNRPDLQARAIDLFSTISPGIETQLERGVVSQLRFADYNDTTMRRTVSGKTTVFVDCRDTARSKVDE